MKALTLTQPWATLVSVGAKQIETRSWSTNYRGRIAIHAAKGFPRNAQNLCLMRPFSDALYTLGDLPRGAIIATAELWDIKHILRELPGFCGEQCLPPPEPERSFGDYAQGRYAWYLRDVKAIEPIPVKGALGLWEWKV
jgi:hypothetical protein